MSCPALPRRGPVWPKPVSEQMTSRGNSADSAAGEHPSRTSTPARKPSMSTSARAQSRRSTPGPSRALRSIAMLRLPRFSASNCSGSPRRRSPSATSSTLTISAPRSASRSVAYGPGYSRVRSTTRKPASGPGMAGAPEAVLPDHLLQLHGKTHVALDLQLAAHARHLRVHLPADDVHEVARGRGHRALGSPGGPRRHRAGFLGQVDRPDAAVVARDVELVDRVHRLGDVGLVLQLLGDLLLEVLLGRGGGVGHGGFSARSVRLNGHSFSGGAA